MKVNTLKHDGRCRWLERKVLKGIFPKMVADAKNPDKKTKYLIIDWISNDNGKVGVDLNWLKEIGVPTVATYKDLPTGRDYAVVNTGYDSIVDEERELRDNGVEIIDLPCPYVRKLRTLLVNADSAYQYILLCEPNHIIIKNFKSLFPKDLILVQMNNYKSKVISEQNGKPLWLIPYVTFLPAHIHQIKKFIDYRYPERQSRVSDTSCMWIKSPVSPIREIENLSNECLKEMTYAVLISNPGSINKSLISLIETIEGVGLRVEIVSDLDEFQIFEKRHKNETVLLVKSPIPNKAEEPILNYLKSA